ncbi:calcium-binding protein [Pseudaestuariivita atlantica]|uniref:calcium-binding protein n=1 Tax=Pseudaestuariivita atlantica TaxID=1317121 RepID=UPI00067E0246|nr:calcium-binding protein [Pseudaestuariivita atlantica]
MTVVYNNQILETGLSHTVDGVTLDFATTAVVGNFTSPPFEGIWFGQTSSASDFVTISFSETVQDIEVSITGADGVFNPPETFTRFAVQLNGGDWMPIDIEVTQTGAVVVTGNTIVTTGSGGSGSFTFTYNGAPFDAVRFFYEQNGSNNGAVLEHVEIQPGEVLFLDFDTAIPEDYVIRQWRDDTGTIREYYETVAGSEPLGTFSAASRAAIVTAVQAIFDRSNLAVRVTDERPTSGDYHSVRFGGNAIVYDDDGDGNNTQLLGVAQGGVDRYNRNPSDLTYVFLDEGDSRALLVETIAHEAAHGFGVRHVNPTPGLSSEVMDYQDSNAPRFVNSVVRIVEPPVDGVMATNETHNPTYHIERYLLGQSDEDLRAEGILPGSWDLTLWDNIQILLDFVGLTGILEDLVVLIDDGNGFMEGREGGVGRTVRLADLVEQGDQISFTLPAGTDFRIIGRTQGSNIADVHIELDGGMTTEANGSLTGTVVQYDSSGNGTNMGSVSGSGTVTETVGDTMTANTDHIIEGTENADNLDGGAMDEVVLALAGNDVVNGFGGNDQVVAGDGDDTVMAGDGNDTVQGGGGANELDGGLGVDLLDFSDVTGRAFADLGVDQTGQGFLRFFEFGQAAGDLYSNFENVTGGGFADNLRGDAAANQLSGEGSSDRLYGRDGFDTIDGGPGADAIYGGLGFDLLTGGSDEGRRDRYIYFSAAESGVGVANRDIITDFVPGEDRIELSRIDADISQGFKQRFDFIGDTAFSGTGGELRYEHVDGVTVVQADRDGDGAADFEIELFGTLVLTESDFLI